MYTVYKITNKINGKIYIGVHVTDNLDDGYMGSGKLIRKSLAKYGVDAFKKEYIAIFDSPEEMFELESTLVNESFVDSRDTYNLKKGGSGSWYHLNSNSEVQRLKALKSNKVQEELHEDPAWIAAKKKKISVSVKKAYAEGRKEINPPDWNDRKHKKESKKRIGAANSKHQKGSGNSQFGTCWIYSEERRESRRIDKTKLETYIGDGWRKGRRMIFNEKS